MTERLRRRMADMETREAAGESLWTDEFGPETRTRLEAIVELWLNEIHSYAEQDAIAQEVDRVLRLSGVRLISPREEPSKYQLLKLIRSAKHDYMPSLVEEV